MDSSMRQHFTNPLPSFDQIHKFQPKERTKKIPRPLNSFMIFRLQSQKEIIRQCPGANHRDISKIISKWWKELSAKEKQAYKDQADKLKAEHHLMYPDYKFCPQKRTTKTRAYRKRAGNEFSALDHQKKQNLYALYQSKPLTSNQDNRYSITYLVDQQDNPSSRAFSSSPTARDIKSSSLTSCHSQLIRTASQYASPASTVCPPTFSQNCSPVHSYDLNVPETQERTLVSHSAYNGYYDSNTMYSNYYSFTGDNYSTVPCYISLLPHHASSNTHFSHYVCTSSPTTIDYYTLDVSEGSQMQASPNVLTQPFLYSL